MNEVPTKRVCYIATYRPRGGAISPAFDDRTKVTNARQVSTLAEI